MLDERVKSSVDELFSDFTQPGRPGCALGIMHQGRLVYVRGYGLANLEHNVPIAPSTVFYIASMSKQFTGLAIALLADQGKIDLDANIRSMLPYVPDFGHVITPRHLLYHTSGLRSDIFLLILAGWRLEDMIRQEDIIRFVKHQRELDFPPGSEFSYCGTGYSLLAELVAKASGSSFPEFCERNIFTPLGMKHSRFELDPTALVPGRASTYLNIGDGSFKNAPLTIGLVGGTGIYTSIEDLALWDENFYTGQVGGPRALQLMQTPGTLNSGATIPYAFGLSVEEFRGRKALSHGGDSAGVHCYMLRLPDEHLTVALLGNASTVRASTLVSSVADIVLGIGKEHNASVPQSEDSVSSATVSSEDLRRRSGRFYDRKTGGFVEIPYESGRLHVYGYELTPTSSDDFFVTGHPEATVAFSSSPDGRQIATIDTGTGPTRYERAEPVDPTPQHLVEFVGTYHSVELDVTWRIKLENNGSLTVHRNRQGTSQLIPMCQDVFTDPWVGEIFHGKAQWVLAFERKNQHVTELRVTAAGGRGRRLRFDKLS